MTFAEFFKLDKNSSDFAKCQSYKKFWKERKKLIKNGKLLSCTVNLIKFSAWPDGQVLYYPNSDNSATITSSINQMNEYERQLVFSYLAKHKEGHGVCLVPRQLPCYISFIEQLIIDKQHFAHLIICRSKNDLIEMKHLLPRNACSVSLFG